MNPLKSIVGTIVCGLILAVILSFVTPDPQRDILLALERWVHLLSGVAWIGLLYYFNFVQVPALAAAGADKDGPGPGAITKYVAPLALDWFRWAALVTWLSGVAYLLSGDPKGLGLMDAITLSGTSQAVGIGAWLGTIMLFNVWVLIWPNQQKILGLVAATDEEKAKARPVALMASRTNTLLSIPMLMFMGASTHGLPF